MRKKRRGSTLQLRISVLTGGEKVSLEGRDIKVFLVDPRGNVFEQAGFLTEGNVITFVYEGKEQDFTGVYRTEIYENYMEDNMASLDLDCFELVPRTDMENDDIDDLAVETIDLASAVQTSLGKADTAVQTETDPTVPSWAKQPSKPTYTAQEVGALPATTSIPSKTSDLTNDSGFITTLPFSMTIGTNTYQDY